MPGFNRTGGISRFQRSVLATRKPAKLLRLLGQPLSRTAERRSIGPSSQNPPRSTRRLQPPQFDTIRLALIKIAASFLSIAAPSIRLHPRHQKIGNVDSLETIRASVED